MSKEVPWSDRVLRFFIEKGALTEDQIFVITTRLKGWTVSKTALEMHKSESSVARIVKDLKIKYDIVQSEYPDQLPLRNKKSVKDKYMDDN